MKITTIIPIILVGTISLSISSQSFSDSNKLNINTKAHDIRQEKRKIKQQVQKNIQAQKEIIQEDAKQKVQKKELKAKAQIKQSHE